MHRKSFVLPSVVQPLQAMFRQRCQFGGIPTMTLSWWIQIVNLKDLRVILTNPRVEVSLSTQGVLCLCSASHVSTWRCFLDYFILCCLQSRQQIDVDLSPKQKAYMDFGEQFARATRNELRGFFAILYVLNCCWLFLGGLLGLAGFRFRYITGESPWINQCHDGLPQPQFFLLDLRWSIEFHCKAVGQKPPCLPWICCFQLLAKQRVSTMCPLIAAYLSNSKWNRSCLVLTTCDRICRGHPATKVQDHRPSSRPTFHRWSLELKSKYVTS